jgi:hypothetical protein
MSECELIPNPHALNATRRARVPRVQQPAVAPVVELENEEEEVVAGEAPAPEVYERFKDVLSEYLDGVALHPSVKHMLNSLRTVLSGLALIPDRDQKVSKLFNRPDPTQNPVEISKSRKLLNPRKIKGRFNTTLYSHDCNVNHQLELYYHQLEIHHSHSNYSKCEVKCVTFRSSYWSLVFVISELRLLAKAVA